MALIKILISLVIYELVNGQSPYRPKTVEGEFCAIPFEHKGVTYHDCTSVGASKPFCYTAANKVVDCAAKPDWGSCDVATSTLPMADVNVILNLVNNLRAKEPALRMTKLRWNSELAQRAQFLSNKCEMSGTINKLCSSSNSMGQISYTSKSYKEQPKKWEEFVNQFFNTKSSYDLDTNKCSATSCNGYVQLMNAKTSDIGCAVTSCNKGADFIDVYHCLFYQPNYMTAPYEKGSTPCTDCFYLGMEEFYKCNSNLCELCDAPGSDCKSLKTEMDAGRVCMDLDATFCTSHANFCTMLDKLDGSSKALITGKCRKTCKLC